MPFFGDVVVEALVGVLEKLVGDLEKHVGEFVGLEGALVQVYVVAFALNHPKGP